MSPEDSAQIISFLENAKTLPAVSKSNSMYVSYIHGDHSTNL